MQINEEKIGEVTVLAPLSRVDSATAKAFETRVLAAISGSAGNIVIDFGQLDYISSAGLRVVLVGAKMCKGGRKFVLCSMKPNIREIFDVSGFAKILTIHPDRDTALKAVS